MFNLPTVIASYLIGPLSFVVTVLKRYGMADPRTYGSGNPGATNVLRSGKKRAAVLTLLGDVLKGIFAVAAARLPQDNLGPSDGIIAVAAVAVLVEHMWSVSFSFKGDKGAATVLGVPLALSWPTTLICAAVWLVMVFGSKVSSLTVLMATVISPLIAYFFMPYGSWVAATTIIAVLVLYRHKGNIKNLLQGKEGKIGDKMENQPQNPNHGALSRQSSLFARNAILPNNPTSVSVKDKPFEVIKKILRPYAKPALLAATAVLSSACSLVRYQPIATINKIDLNSGYHFETDRQSQNNADGDDIYIVLMFSGSGTRAAVLGCGVLEQLNRQKVNIDGRKKTLMQNVDVVIGVSGGSVPVAYFALHGQGTIPSFDRRFLRLNFQKLTIKQVFSFTNLLRLTSPEFGRSDLLQEQFETHLFGKATFTDLEERRKGPFTIISVTDMGLGERTNFTQEYFDLMYTNLGNLRIARAVVASSAVSMVFAPVTLNNDGGNCNYNPPKDTTQAVVPGQNAQQNKTQQEYVTRYRRYDSKTRPYIHLFNGGLTDNFGIRSPPDMADVYSSSMLMCRMMDHNIHRAVITNASARDHINSNIDTKAAIPGLGNVLSSIVDISIDRYSQESLHRLCAFADKWNEDSRNTGDSRKITLPSVSLSLDDLPESELRSDVLNIPTSSYLPPDDIVKLRTATAILAKQSPEYREPLEDLSAKPNKAAICQETAALSCTASQGEPSEINNLKAGADSGGNSDNDGKQAFQTASFIKTTAAAV